jgi:acetylglutamate kinase
VQKKQLTIVKIGGNVIDNPTLRQQFIQDFAALPSPKILVHGGGKIATQMAVKLGIETVMVEGRRITDQAMLEVVTMVYGGLVNKQLVAALQAQQCNALGLTGADGGLIQSHKRPVKEIDYGFVGDIEQVNTDAMNTLLDAGFCPVFAPLTFDKHGQLLNTNADTQAQSLATALAPWAEVNLVFCFEKKGVLQNPDDDESVISQLTPAKYEQYKTQGIISAGMIPKLDNAFRALQLGVKQVTICHARDLQAAVQHHTTGTQIVWNA